MEKTTVYLDADQRRRLLVVARAQARPQAELIREAIDEYLSRRPPPRLPSWVGIADTDALDSTKIREYRQEWAEHLDRKHGVPGT